MTRNVLWMAAALLPFTSIAKPVASDTISFSTNQVEIEDYPNQGEHCIAMFSPDGNWKMQLYYWADGLFGEFDNESFKLTGDGKYYNFVRNPKNDMQFYSLTDIQLKVTDELTNYRIEANCKASNGTRYLVEGTYEVPMATDTVRSDLGFAWMMHNGLYGTYTYKAENDHFSLEYGTVGELPEGKFYTTDLLMPELYDKKEGRKIIPTGAMAVHEWRNDTLWMTLSLLSEEAVLYELTMYQTEREPEVTGEEEIVMTEDIILMDYTMEYGFYQLSAHNQEWAVVLTFEPILTDENTTGRIELALSLPYTKLLHIADEQLLDLYKATAWIENGMASADLYCTNGMLYHIVMTEDNMIEQIKSDSPIADKAWIGRRCVIKGQFDYTGKRKGE